MLAHLIAAVASTTGEPDGGLHLVDTLDPVFAWALVIVLAAGGLVLWVGAYGKCRRCRKWREPRCACEIKAKWKR